MISIWIAPHPWLALSLALLTVYLSTVAFFLFLCVCLVIFNQMLGLTYREAIAIEANIIYTLKWAPFFYQYMWVIGLI